MFSPKNGLLFLWIGLAWVFMQCASPQPLTGGAKDETPPKIIEEASTPNKQTSFTQKEIVLTFDEWVVLKDIDAQLVISPLMPDKPEIKQKGKSIIITVPDSLTANTTYTMNFGNAIQDLNENNKLENYSFVFSTGTFLDSIQLNGNVIDAVTLKPAENVWVMLYPAGDDSLAYKQKPEYLSKTYKEGHWTISNIRSDSFRIVALKDENLNFIYDQESELFGWLDTIHYTTTSTTLPEIVVSPREKKSVIAEVRHPYPGHLTIALPNVTAKPVLIFEPELEDAVMEWEKDSLQIWYKPDINYAGRVIMGNDTTRIRASDGSSIKNNSIKLKPLTGRLHPNESVKIMADLPLEIIDTSRIEIRKDTSGLFSFHVEGDSTTKRIFSLTADWISPTGYQLRFLKDAVRDIWGRSSDTFNYVFIVNALDQFSNLDMNITGLDSSTHYIVWIKSGEVIERTYYINYQTSAKILSKGLQPSRFIIELIEDRNGNGRWDTGNFILKRQPEKRKIFTPENLRAGWDVELNMDWKPSTPVPDKGK